MPAMTIKRSFHTPFQSMHQRPVERRSKQTIAVVDVLLEEEDDDQKSQTTDAGQTSSAQSPEPELIKPKAKAKTTAVVQKRNSVHPAEQLNGKRSSDERIVTNGSSERRASNAVHHPVNNSRRDSKQQGKPHHEPENDDTILDVDEA